jgi:YD repeat-containing protein
MKTGIRNRGLLVSKRHKRLSWLIVCSFAVSVLLPSVMLADGGVVLPGFNGESGINPFRDQIQNTANEYIDPFSGLLNLTYVDLHIPGPGGMDIKVIRSYNSNSVYMARQSNVVTAPYLTRLFPKNTMGLGWNIHFGRILKLGFVGGTSLSPCGVAPLLSAGNPILETPDGRQQVLFLNSTNFPALFMTREQWVATCIGISEGLLVISPDGIKYTMNYRRVGYGYFGSDQDPLFAWYTIRIEDANGNYINVSYDTSTTYQGLDPIIKSLTRSDGQTVSFSYTFGDYRTINGVYQPTDAKLRSVSGAGKTYRYGYTAVPDNDFSNFYYLRSVTRPDGLTWGYSYRNTYGDGSAGDKILSSVTYPHGGAVSYTWGYVCFNADSCSESSNLSNGYTFYSLVVRLRSQSGPSITPGAWSFSYNPATTGDTTTVSFPGGAHVYEHYGIKSATGGTIWRVGLLKSKRTYASNPTSSSQLIQSETYQWSAPLENKVSNQRLYRPAYNGVVSNYWSDLSVLAPTLTNRTVVRDGTTYSTTYSSFDVNLNPTVVTEAGQETRSTRLTYYSRVAGQNIVNRVKDEVVSPTEASKNIYRSYDAKGRLTYLNHQGVAENYTYYITGDLASRTNARQQVWTYSDYYRGVPRRENHPEGMVIFRTVNGTGTIATETNGRGKTTAYVQRHESAHRYQSAGRQSNWHRLERTGRNLDARRLRPDHTFDGFGRPVSVSIPQGSRRLFTTMHWDAGHSNRYPNSTSGDQYSHDVLGRLAVGATPDGTSRSIRATNRQPVVVTNERNNTFTYHYRSFGDPDRQDDRVLMQVTAPEGMTTSFNRDILGNITSISQGSVTRGYGYNSSNFVTSESNPETGTTVYGRDAVGNMTSRRVGSSSTTTYTYDGLNRLTRIDYPGSTPDVTFQYDDNSNLTLADNGIARRVLTYDNNDNLTAETLTVGGRSFTAAYAYTSLDYLSAITYPSGRQVSYAPDDLGRPTRATPYLTASTTTPTAPPAGWTTPTARSRPPASTTANGSPASPPGVRRRRGRPAYDYDGLANVTSIIEPPRQPRQQVDELRRRRPPDPRRQRHPRLRRPGQPHRCAPGPGT